jgi:hypothetical protein
MFTRGTLFENNCIAVNVTEYMGPPGTQGD